MAKIYPNNNNNNSSEDQKETFTMWMKSLVFHGNGCTIFNSKGELVYRVDNYRQKCRRKVLLMDSIGNVLFSINRKKLRVFGCWNVKSKVDKERPWFQVIRNHTIMSKDILSCRVVARKCGENTGNGRYKIIGLKGKSSLKIIDHFSGQLLAEAVQKQSSGGVCLGEDVLTLTVEPKTDDQPLLMALITVYGLINNKL